MRALISVSDKTGVVEFAKGLASHGVQILSTGGTARALREAGLNVTDVSEVTGFPEILDGRVKTLHPKVHGGLLAVRDNPEHMQILKEQGIETIDMVVVNLYPFEKTVAKEDVSEDEAIENIDIGGPSMIRSAAKNFKSVTVVVDPSDYDDVIAEISAGGDTTLEFRKKLARKAFTKTFQYDEAIDHYFRKQLGEPELLDLHYEKVMSLRYGENPHQKAVFFRNPENHDSNITNAQTLHGKQLSFNNIVDGDSALELVKEFERPAAAIIKHNNPCGVATANTIEEALVAAFEVDTMSAFGGVLALNHECTSAVADFVLEKKWFLEIIIAPSFAKETLEKLDKKKDLRLLATGPLVKDLQSRDIKKVAGGILVQTKDTYIVNEGDLKVVTKKAPSAEEIRAMLFANVVVKHVHSNAVVFAKVQGNTEVATGIGAGQMSRVDSVFIGATKGGEKIPGSVMASDAFFPFSDAVEQAAKYGVTAIIQPGGSIRDDEVFKKSDELGMSMVTTGYRFFRH
ncbi:MAG: bifunctional phosphoribosylaminoimidazolecarboxamide formyltransferase/IMP cyclohydrolase [Candidatus Peregrinibacteria bacterium]|nr:bifunctional phosphoribosylaminoimidazolecarboxamide formyltransferase/IMP cyclohydrolase [Candidatus Peregrinibacteria bacterium]